MRPILVIALFTLLGLALAERNQPENDERELSRVERSAEPARSPNSSQKQKKAKKSKRVKGRRNKGRKGGKRKGRKGRKGGKRRGKKGGKKGGKRKGRKGGKRKGRKGGKKKGRKVGKKSGRKGMVRAQGRVLKGSGCQYIYLSEILSRVSTCQNGYKFVLKGESGVRRQFLLIGGKVVLAFVSFGTKFAACTSFTDVTNNVICKKVDGLENIDLSSTSAPGTTASSSGDSSTSASSGASSTAGSSSSAGTSAATSAASSSAATSAASTSASAGASTSSSSSSFKCGVKKSGTRVVGGTEATVNEYPWMVLITSRESGLPHGCGGTLVSQEWVISAAHCFYTAQGNFTAKDLSVALGDHDINSDTETTRTVIEVETLVLHPNWSPTSTNNEASDIALLKLKTKADLNKYTPACIASKVDTSLVGKTVWVYGWGLTAFQGNESTKLLEASMPVVSRDTCNQQYSGQIVDGMICAGGTSVGPCNGDSGGPLTYPDPSSGQHTLVGVVSFGEKCDTSSGKYAVFSDVGYFKTWIDTQVAANGGINLTP